MLYFICFSASHFCWAHNEKHSFRMIIDANKSIYMYIYNAALSQTSNIVISAAVIGSFLLRGTDVYKKCILLNPPQWSSLIYHELLTPLATQCLFRLFASVVQ